MEVLLCKKINANKEITQLFSKLQSHQWPSINKLLDSIVEFVPRFNLTINIYDKESGILDFNKDYEDGKEEDFSYSKFEHIKINVFYLNNEKLKEICNNAAEEIETFLNPKKKLELMQTMKSNTRVMDITSSKIKGESDFNSSKISKKIFSDRPNTVLPKHLRPLTGFTSNPLDDNSKISRQNFTNPLSSFCFAVEKRAG